MAQESLVTQNSELIVQVPATGIKGCVLSVDAAAHDSAAVTLMGQGAAGGWYTLAFRKSTDETVVTSISDGESGWQWLFGWKAVKAVRTDANGGACLVMLEVR